MTGTRNPSRKYFKRNQPYFYKSIDNWEEWDTDESYDRTFFIGVDDSNPEDIDVALYMIWGGKPVAVVGDKVLDTISGVVEIAEQLEEEIQSILEEVQELATAVAQSEIDIEEAIAAMNELVDRCDGILDGAEAARDLAKDWATKMDGMVEEEGEPVDYSSKYYAGQAHADYIAMTTDENVVAVGQNITAVQTVATGIQDVGTVADIAAAVSTVASNDSNITTVATDITNVNIVAVDTTNIDTVAGISSDVTTVAGISSDVTAVKNNATDISAVAANGTNITAVAGNATNINMVAGDTTNIDAVAGNKTNIDTVAGISSDVTAVAGVSSDVSTVSVIASDVSTVAGIDTNVSTVATSISDVTTVATNISDVSTVASNATNIDTVAGISSNVTTVAGVSSDVSSVAGNATNINTVATNISDVNTAASNIAAIQAAPTQASNAEASATLAQNWATKMDGMVDGDYSAKWYATDAKKSRNIGEKVTSTVPLIDAGLHLEDGSLISGSGSYADFVAYMAGLVSTDPSLFTTEVDWQASVAAYGVCGKYVYDSVNNTIRLPKVSSQTRTLIKSSNTGKRWSRIYSDGWCEQGGIEDSGVASVTVSLPVTMSNTNYSISVTGYYNTSDTGGLSISTSPVNYPSTVTTSGFTISVATTYYAAWEVKGYTDISAYLPETLYEYIVVANSTKTQIEVDIDQIATDLNGKADVDLSNINASSSAMQTIAGWGFPDESAGVALTGLSTSNTNFTATTDGFVRIHLSFSNGTERVYLDDNCVIWGHDSGAVDIWTDFIPVKAGTHTKRTSSNASRIPAYMFYPIRGR